jgi:hypothetical protein
MRLLYMVESLDLIVRNRVPYVRTLREFLLLSYYIVNSLSKDLQLFVTTETDHLK